MWLDKDSADGKLVRWEKKREGGRRKPNAWSQSWDTHMVPRMGCCRDHSQGWAWLSAQELSSDEEDQF